MTNHALCITCRGEGCRDCYGTGVQPVKPSEHLLAAIEEIDALPERPDPPEYRDLDPRHRGR